MVTLAVPLFSRSSAAILSSSGPVSLAAGPVVLSLNTGEALDTQAKRFSLVVRGLTAAASPGVVYNIYLNLPPGAVPAKIDPRFIGQINFFGANEEPVGSRFNSFDVTGQIRRLLSENPRERRFTITIHPVGVPEAGSKPAIERVELVSH
jgi:hypothetical protein